MKVPLGNNFEDYDADDPDIGFRKKRWDYWKTLGEVRVEYLSKTNQTAENFDFTDFVSYLEKNYGIKMILVHGKITDKFDITDEKLYSFFILKHG